MKNILSAAAIALCLIGPAFAGAPVPIGAHPPGSWYLAMVDGIEMLAPPPECLVRPPNLPNYIVIRMSQDKIDALDRSIVPTDTGIRWGLTIRPGYVPGQPKDTYEVVLTTALHGDAAELNLEHEMAHLRGCTHPGFDDVTNEEHRDWTPNVWDPRW